MIIDTLENWDYYHFGPAWKTAFDFLRTLSPGSEERKYAIDGSNMFAEIACYETISKETTSFESHRKYIDIQTILTGAEIIEVTPSAGLTVNTPYNDTNDVEFYNYSKTLTKINLYPGTFTMLFPHDAHMPGLTPQGKPEQVKKVVVKIKKELLITI